MSRDTAALRERSRRGKIRSGETCPDCGCGSWVRTSAGRQICGFCAYPDSPRKEARNVRDNAAA